MSDAQPTPADLVITDAIVLVHADADAVDFAEDRTIVVRGGLIEVDLRIPATARSDPVPAARRAHRRPGMLAMPGFINCHTHSPMVMFRGAAEDVPRPSLVQRVHLADGGEPHRLTTSSSPPGSPPPR